MPKAFQVMTLMPKYKAPPADIQPSSMGPKWLDCKNHCLKYMPVFLGLLIVLLISSKVWWLFQLPCESSTCVHWSYLCSWPGITIFFGKQNQKVLGSGTCSFVGSWGIVPSKWQLPSSAWAKTWTVRITVAAKCCWLAFFFLHFCCVSGWLSKTLPLVQLKWD